MKDNRPEWLNDADEENVMTFDDRGKFISVKELKTKNIPHEETNLPNENKKEEDPAELLKAATKESSEKSDTAETEIKQQQQEKSNEPIESNKTTQPIEVTIDSNQSVENLLISNAEVLQQKLAIQQQQQQLQTKLQMEESLSQKLNKISLNEVRTSFILLPF